MDFEIPDLPYAVDALEPHISARTVSIHYEKHHQGYLQKLRREIENKPEARRSLEDLIASAQGDVYDNAAQVWNHTFYWRSMNPKSDGRPSGAIATEIERSFGSLADFKQQFAEAANGEFGSGWAWLVADPTGRLRVHSSSDAESPLCSGNAPLLTLDVWEHAYYLDYQNERDRYVESFLDHLIAWDFAAANLRSTETATAIR